MCKFVFLCLAEYKIFYKMESNYFLIANDSFVKRKGIKQRKEKSDLYTYQLQLRICIRLSSICSLWKSKYFNKKIFLQIISFIKY
jgi:hypothetical protein